MSFVKNDYLQWYVSKMMAGESLNLHSSGMRALELGEVTPVIDGNPWMLSDRFAGALADWLKLPSDQVVFTPGATGGTLLALLALTDPKPYREMIVEAPVYEPLRLQAERLGVVKRFWRSSKDEWALPIERIEELISDSTDVVMITEPTNPGGVSRPRAEILRLADIAQKNGALLLINEVYRGFTDEPSYHLERGNIIVVSSLSKLFGAYAMRLGWISASADRIADLKMAHMNFGAPSAPSAAVGIGLMERATELESEAKRLARGAIATVDQWVASQENIRWVRPQSMGFGCIDLPEHLEDDVALADRLFETHKVLTIPGTFFDAPGTLRISWLQTGDDLSSGLERLASMLA